MATLPRSRQCVSLEATVPGSITEKLALPSEDLLDFTESGGVAIAEEEDNFGRAGRRGYFFSTERPHDGQNLQRVWTSFSQRGQAMRGEAGN